MVLRDIEQDDKDSICLAQITDLWWAFVITVVNLYVP
jgi:hypothetical protein